MLLADVVATSSDVAATSSRKAKVERLAALLRTVPPDELVQTVAWLTGELRQRQIGVGYASLRDRPPPAVGASLGITEADTILETIGRQSGPGSQGSRRALLAELFGRATET